MVFRINGNRENLSLGVSKSGYPICDGNGKQDCRPSDPLWNLDAVRSINAMDFFWTVAQADDAKSYWSYPDDGLSERIRANPSGSYISIRVSASYKRCDMVIVLPELVFNRVLHLFEIVMTSNTLAFCFIVDFLGCAKEGANTGVPTWAEFLAGKPYLSEEVSFSIFEDRAVELQVKL